MKQGGLLTAWNILVSLPGTKRKQKLIYEAIKYIYKYLFT